MPDSVYYVEVSVQRATVTVALNGVELRTVGGPDGGFVAMPVNANLVGTAPDGSANRLVLAVRPAPDSAAAAALDALAPEARALALADLYDAVGVTGLVKRYRTGDVAGLGSADGEVVARFDLAPTLERVRAERARAFAARVEATPPAARAGVVADSARQLAPPVPVEITVAFESPGAAGFRARLLEAEPAEREAVLDYALALRDMAARRDVDALTEAFRPKLEDYDQAYPEEAEDNQAFVADMFQSMYPSGLQLDFGRDDVNAVPYNERRVWRLRVERSGQTDALFLTRGDDGFISRVDVFVGMVDGRLRVIR